MRIAVAGSTGVVGRLLVDVAKQHGHQVVGLTRSAGYDLTTGAGLAEALAGVAVLVDVSGPRTTFARTPATYFERSTTQLLEAGRSAGVRHHVALSIVGIERFASGYYVGKQRQEALVAAGPTSWSVLRTTQFHEFAEQVHQQARFGPLVPVPVMSVQPVAAAEVAEALVTLAEAPPCGRAPDLAGPRPEQLADLVRRLGRATGVRAAVLPVRLPGSTWRSIRTGALLPGPNARRGRQTFESWLAATH